MPNKQSKILVAVGSNLGARTVDVTETVREGIFQLEREGCVIRKQSRFFETPCFPAGAGPDFVNACLWLEADWSPEHALSVLHKVEHDFGRTRDVRWGPRSLDLDLLAVDDQVLPDPETYAKWRDLPPEQQSKVAPDRLILPHPRMQDRAFVLVPLADVAPDWRHPVLDRTVLQMLDGLSQSDISDVKPLVNQGNRA